MNASIFLTWYVSQGCEELKRGKEQLDHIDRLRISNPSNTCFSCPGAMSSIWNPVSRYDSSDGVIRKCFLHCGPCSTALCHSGGKSLHLLWSIDRNYLPNQYSGWYPALYLDGASIDWNLMAEGSFAPDEIVLSRRDQIETLLMKRTIWNSNFEDYFWRSNE